jgi:hypothetical protein
MTGAVALCEGRVELPSWATAARRAKRGLEKWIRGLPLPEIVRKPARLLRRGARRKRYE